MMRARQSDAAIGRIRSSSGKLVYLYLETSGGSTVTELKDALGLSQVRLYPILSTLRDRGLVERRDDTYVASD